MKKKSTATPAEALTEATPTPVPVLDPGTKPLQLAYRDEESTRTVGYHQPGADGLTDLFSPTGVFIRSEAAPQDFEHLAQPTPEPKEPTGQL